MFVINTVLSDTYWVGCKTSALTLFLWFVSVTLDLPAAKSHRRMVQSWLPVITYKIQNSIKPLKNEPCTDWWNLTIEWLHFQPSPHFMDLWMAWTTYVCIILQKEMNHQKLSTVLDLSCMGHITWLYPVFIQIRSSISVAQH